MVLQGQVFQVIVNLWKSETSKNVSFTDIKREYDETFCNGKDFSLSPKKLGGVVRNVFDLSTVRGNKGYCIVRSEKNEGNIAKLASKYGVSFESDRKEDFNE